MSTRIEERPDGTRRVSIYFDENVPEERSRTKPEFGKGLDRNRIMKKYMKSTGMTFEQVTAQVSGIMQGNFGDFSSGLEFSDAMRKIAGMDELFLALPSPIRNKFRNDAAALIDFVMDPRNDEESYTLGLKVRPKVVVPEPPPKAPVV